MKYSTLIALTDRVRADKAWLEGGTRSWSDIEARYRDLGVSRYSITNACDIAGVLFKPIRDVGVSVSSNRIDDILACLRDIQSRLASSETGLRSLAAEVHALCDAMDLPPLPVIGSNGDLRPFVPGLRG